MQVLLRKDVTGIGKRGETAEISERFARRVLIPRGLAEPGKRDRTKKEEKAASAGRNPEQRRKEEAEALKRALSRAELTLPIHVEDDGSPKGRIDAEAIADALIEEYMLFVDSDDIRVPTVYKLGRVQAEIQLEDIGRAHLALHLVAHPDDIKKLRNKLERDALEIVVSADESGRVHGRIDAKTIANALEKQRGVHLDPDDIRVPAVRKLGSAQAEIQLPDGARARLELQIIPKNKR